MSYLLKLRLLPTAKDWDYNKLVQKLENYHPVAIPAGLVVMIEPHEPWMGNHIHSKLHLYTDTPYGKILLAAESIEEIEKQLNAK